MREETLLSLSGDETEAALFIAGYLKCFMDVLRDKKFFPNPEINRLMDLFFNLTSQEVVPLTISKMTNCLTFWHEKEGIKEIARVLVPVNFVDISKRDPLMQLGSLVSVASLVRDFYNDRCDPEGASEERALAYEAEFLLTTQRIKPDFTPNEHQGEVLELYPQGLESLPPSLRYQSIMPLTSVGRE